jgi:hypothetical protein
MALLFSNNAVSKLSGAIASGATAASVQPGEGARFPANAGADWYPLTLLKADGSYEIVRCTLRVGDVLTLVRAQESTIALAFSAGDRIELRITAAALNEMMLPGTTKLSLAGGKMTGDIILDGANASWNYAAVHTAGGNYAVRKYTKAGAPDTSLLYITDAGEATFVGAVTAPSFVGNASTASTLTGFGAGGLQEVGRTQDWHAAANGYDYDVRLQVSAGGSNGAGTLVVSGSGGQSFAGPMTLNTGYTTIDYSAPGGTFNLTSIRCNGQGAKVEIGTYVGNFHYFGGSVGDGVMNLGWGLNRWSTVYAANGAISTSDARKKTSVTPLSANEIAAAQEIGLNFGTFKWLEAIEQKGEAAARKHVGQTVQWIMSVMESHGLVPFDYGFICFDEDQAREEYTSLGGEVTPATPYRSIYSLRTDQLAMFVARGQAARSEALEARIAALEAMV